MSQFILEFFYVMPIVQWIVGNWISEVPWSLHLKQTHLDI